MKLEKYKDQYLPEQIYHVFNRGNGSENTFKNFLISYSKIYNKQYKRKGSLWIQNCKRVHKTELESIQRLFAYVLLNPVKDYKLDHPRKWEYSSYHEMISKISSKHVSKLYLDYFNSQEHFNEYIEERVLEYYHQWV